MTGVENPLSLEEYARRKAEIGFCRNDGYSPLPEEHLEILHIRRLEGLAKLRQKVVDHPDVAKLPEYPVRLEDARYLSGETDRHHENIECPGQAIVAADPSLADPAPPFKLTLAEYEARVLRLDEVEKKLSGKPFKPWALAWLQRYALSELPEVEQRLSEAMKDRDKAIARVPDLQEQIDRLRYLTGETDTHPFFDGDADTKQEQETILAGELCGKHLGLTVRSLTFPDKNKATRATRGDRTYRIDTIHHLKNGAILINSSWPYLRHDTVLTIVDEGSPDD